MKALITDFSRVLVFAYAVNDKLNAHHRELSTNASYQFFDHFYLNDELLAYYQELARRVPIYIYSTGRLHQLPEVSPRLDGIITDVFLSESETEKSHPESFGVIAEKLGLEPGELVFIDDRPENVAAAEDAGLVALHYKTSGQAIHDLKRLASI